MRRLEEQPPIPPKGVFEKNGFKVFELYILISQKLFDRFSCKSILLCLGRSPFILYSSFGTRVIS